MLTRIAITLVLILVTPVMTLFLITAYLRDIWAYSTGNPESVTGNCVEDLKEAFSSDHDDKNASDRY